MQRPPTGHLLLVALLSATVFLPSALAQKARFPKAWKHLYWEHEPQDECSLLLRKVASGEVRLDTSSEETFLRSLLAALDVPVSSQLLVYTATSIQKKVSRKNPRAIYFNEETYVAMVPGSVVEVTGMDPDFGGIFYEFEAPLPGVVPVAERLPSCITCHADRKTQHVPGLVVESTVLHPGARKYQVYWDDPAGHHVPLELRFGGWFVTSTRPFGPTKEGLVAERTKNSDQVMVTRLAPAQRHDTAKYPAPTSDLLAHLLHEHQAGFHNLMVQAAFLCRDVQSGKAPLTAEHETWLDEKAREIVRYVLFADEARLPAGGVEGDPQFVKDFARNRRPGRSGAALKDLDLRTRLFKYRCSYMVYSLSWRKLPELIKSRVYALLKEALTGNDAAFAYLPADERKALLDILGSTLPDLPDDWPSKP